MRVYYPAEIRDIIKPVEAEVVNNDTPLWIVLTDSRKVTDGATTLFFAIQTKRNNGAKYIMELYDKGVRNFVVPELLDDDISVKISALHDANIFYVKDTIIALQRLVAWHREQYDIPVVGITGSNGKTIVKDWIVQLLDGLEKPVSSPKSYNSQIGVPLSVWQMSEEHSVGVFEAGISEVGEMVRIQKVINPTIGIFTNIGQAHDEHFLTRNQKIAEKLQLFTHCDVLIYCLDHKEIHSLLSGIEAFRDVRCFTWTALNEDAEVRLKRVELKGNATVLEIEYNGHTAEVEIPFTDKASIENAMHAITLMLYWGYGFDEIATRTKTLVSVEMRLELKEAINDCLLINDGYSLDLNSLVIALDFIQQEKQHAKKTLVMSDIMQTGIIDAELYAGVAKLIEQRNITKFIGIGSALCRNKDKFAIESSFYETTGDFLKHYLFSNFQNETILLKGARVFEFERIAKLLQRKTHQTVMEVNLHALIDNLNYYRSRISADTKIMAMVKAFSYGAGNVEVANTLQFNNVDYLTVAYSDEGVDLRKNGITLPIMVMNPEEESFDDIIKYNLEPVIYSFRILDEFTQTASMYCDADDKIRIHIEMDTGMHRLGFMEDDMPLLIEKLNANKAVKVCSIFSHLACSEDAAMDAFTLSQIDKFKLWSAELKAALKGQDKILCHILNSSGIVRFGEAEMDMVRLGIGLYGVAPDPEVQKHLTLISKLKTKISQIKRIPKGDTVGYNCNWTAQRDSVIAVIPIGYADGLSRKMGNGVGKVMIHGTMVPIVGKVCMDMCFADITDVDCVETDDVVIFDNHLMLNKMATDMDTIPYEILTSISSRVKRVYYWE